MMASASGPVESGSWISWFMVPGSKYFSEPAAVFFPVAQLVQGALPFGPRIVAERSHRHPA
jgi:hypothetical protein